MQKYSIELTLPTVGENTPEATKCVVDQVRQATEAIKALLGMYKKAGLEVPSLAFKLPKGVAPKKVEENEFTVFSRQLINHLLQHMPKEDVGVQMRAIKALYATGMTAEQLIEMFESVRAEYPLTTWLTVRYNLNKKPEIIENKGFTRRELTEMEAFELKERVKNYLNL